MSSVNASFDVARLVEDGLRAVNGFDVKIIDINQYLAIMVF